MELLQQRIEDEAIAVGQLGIEALLRYNSARIFTPAEQVSSIDILTAALNNLNQQLPAANQVANPQTHAERLQLLHQLRTNHWEQIAFPRSNIALLRNKAIRSLMVAIVVADSSSYASVIPAPDTYLGEERVNELLASVRQIELAVDEFSAPVNKRQRKMDEEEVGESFHEHFEDLLLVSNRQATLSKWARLNLGVVARGGRVENPGVDLCELRTSGIREQRHNDYTSIRDKHTLTHVNKGYRVGRLTLFYMLGYDFRRCSRGNGFEVSHLCAMKGCVNPGHLMMDSVLLQNWRRNCIGDIYRRHQNGNFELVQECRHVPKCRPCNLQNSPYLEFVFRQWPQA